MMDNSNSKTIAKNTIYLYFRMILVMLVTFYTSRVVLKALGVEDFGIYNIVGSVVVFLSFLQSALTNATYRFIAYELGTGDNKELNKVYSMAINCHMLLAIGLLIVMEVAGVWFLNHKLNIDSTRMYAANWLFQFSLLTFFFGIIRTPFNSNIIAHEKMSFYAIISILEAVLKLIVVFLLTISVFDKLILYGFLLSIVAIIILLGYLFYCKLYIKDTSFYFCWDRGLFKKYISYSGWSLFVNAADVSTQQCISIFFNWFVGVVGNAALGISNQVIGGLNMFISNFSSAFNPQLIKSYASKRYDYFMNLIFSTSKISYLLYIILAVPVVTNINLLLSFWLGDYPVMAAEFVSVAVLYYMIDSLQSPLFQAVHATGNIKTHHILVGTIKFLAIPGIYITLKLGYSAVSALLIWGFFNLTVSIVRTIYMRSLISLDIKKYVSQVIIPLSIVTAITVGLSYLLRCFMSESWLRFFVIFCCSTTIILILSLMMIFNKQEKALLRQMPILNKILK